VANDKQRRTVYYSGHVQGVGFRFTTRRVASRFDVTGFVQNLPDGRVQLVVEGTPAEISLFLAEIATTFAGNISDVQADITESQGNMDGFEVRA